MTIIAEKDRPTIQDLLARELVEDVELLLFTQDRTSLYVPGQQDSQTCEETRELLEELAALSDHLHLTTYDVGADPAAATAYTVTAVPTVIVRRRRCGTETPNGAGGAANLEAQPTGTESLSTAPGPRAIPAELGANVRFLGLPSGYEFSTLLADIVDVSKGRTDLSAEALDVVRGIETPVHIQVFVTPT